MNVDIEGVPVRVPARYPTYTGLQQDAIRRMVIRLKQQYGDRLINVHVDRLVPVATRLGWRVDGGCSTT